MTIVALSHGDGDPAVVGVLHRLGNVTEQIGGVLRRARAEPFQLGCQVRPLYERHRQVRHPVAHVSVEHRTDARVVQAGGGAGLGQNAVGGVGRRVVRQGAGGPVRGVLGLTPGPSQRLPRSIVRSSPDDETGDQDMCGIIAVARRPIEPADLAF